MQSNNENSSLKRRRKSRHNADASNRESKISMQSNRCSCKNHVGKEMLNKVYNLSVNYLWESLFGPTKFCYDYWASRKFYDFEITDWLKSKDNLIARQLEFYVDLGMLGRPKNVEKQVSFGFLKSTRKKCNICIFRQFWNI